MSEKKETSETWAWGIPATVVWREASDLDDAISMLEAAIRLLGWDSLDELYHVESNDGDTEYWYESKKDADAGPIGAYPVAVLSRVRED